jgi:AcrR family transcriptional regulator
VARSIPEGRFARVIAAATDIFVLRGYRLTQMSDVAEAIGVAKGTLYGYVESKEALFDAAVRWADGQAPDPVRDALPLPTPAPGSTASFIGARLLQEANDLELARALARPSGARAKPHELEFIVRDLYQRMFRNRRALKLVDRCAIDHPELASLWYEQGRGAQLGMLASYLEARAKSGALRRIADPELAARLMLETIALWAIHMPWDPSPNTYDEAAVERAVVDLLVHAYCKEKNR